MAKRLVIDEEAGSMRHPIRPEHISLEEHFWSAFGDNKAETSAQWIVRFCQLNDGWKPFAREDMQGIYHAVFFPFNGLDDERRGFVVLGKDGKYRVTHEFICRCFLASPSQTIVPELQLVG